MKKYFFLLLVLFSSPVFAGCLYQGICQTNGAALLANINISYPVDSSGYKYLIAPGYVSTASDACVVTGLRLNKIDLINGAVTNGISQNYTYPTCDATVGTFNAYSVQDILFVLGVIALWAFGFKSGQMR